MSADGKRLAVLSGSKLSVVEVDGGEEVAAFPFEAVLWRGALAPDGSRLASLVGGPGSASMAVEILDVGAGKLVERLEGATSALWSGDGRFLLTLPDLRSGGARQPAEPGAGDSSAGEFEVIRSFEEGRVHELALEVTPTYVDRERYAVEGAIRIDGGPEIAVKGEVEGKQAQRYLLPASFCRNPRPSP